MGRRDTSTMNYGIDRCVSVVLKPNTIAISFQHKAPISIHILINIILFRF